LGTGLKITPKNGWVKQKWSVPVPVLLLLLAAAAAANSSLLLFKLAEIYHLHHLLVEW